jgi:hypothetical protein
MNENLYNILTCRFQGPVEKMEAIKNAAKELRDNEKIPDWYLFICLVCKATSKCYPKIHHDWLVSLILAEVPDESLKKRIKEAMPCLESIS